MANGPPPEWPRGWGHTVKKHVLLAALAGGLAIAGQRLARRYRLDRGAACARLAAVDRTAVMTRFGTVEYAQRGSGEPVSRVWLQFQDRWLSLYGC
jgi:hypothetical protein